MSILSMLKATEQGYSGTHDDNYFFANSSFNDIGKDEELTKFFLKQVDPDGSKYGGDIEKAKTGFLNDYTFKSNSITSSVLDAV